MKQVTINGTTYPCRLTVGVLKRYKDQTGKEVEDVRDIFSISELLFMALQSTCRKEKVPLPYASAEELMDDLDLSEMNGITESLFGKTDGGCEKKTETEELIKLSVLPSE